MDKMEMQSQKAKMGDIKVMAVVHKLRLKVWAIMF